MSLSPYCQRLIDGSDDTSLALEHGHHNHPELNQSPDAPEAAMPVLRKEGPYIWITWLTKLLTSDDSCEHDSWFKTQFDSNSGTRAERVTNLVWYVGM